MTPGRPGEFLALANVRTIVAEKNRRRGFVDSRQKLDPPRFRELPDVPISNRVAAVFIASRL